MKLEKMRATTLVKAVGALALTLLILGIGAYMLSDVYRTKIDQQVREIQRWTPKNIAEDPLNYLNFMEEKTNEAMMKLKANRVSTAQSRSRLASTRDETQQAVDTGDTLLRELKDKYQDAEANGSWPIQWKGREFTKAQARQQIKRLYEEVEQKRTLLDRTEKSLEQVKQSQNRIVEARNKAEMQLATIDSKREMVKVQGITDDIKSDMVDMKGVLQGVSGVAEEDTGARGLDSLMASEPEQVNDDDMNEIFQSIDQRK